MGLSPSSSAITVVISCHKLFLFNIIYSSQVIFKNKILRVIEVKTFNNLRSALGEFSGTIRNLGMWYRKK